MKITCNHILILAITTLAAVTSCTDLTETMYPQVTQDNFLRERSDVKAAFFRAYPHTNWLLTWNNMKNLQELSADQLAIPQKGRHWFDNGIYVRLHRHTWTPEHPQIWDAWNGLYQGIGYLNQNLEDFAKIDLTQPQFGYAASDTTEMMAELRIFRAWYYLKLIDLFGNVPVITKVGEPQSPPIQSRDEVFAWVEQQITDNVDQILTKDDNGSYGRITQAAAWTMLAKLYMNAEVYTGTARWEDAVAACDKILSGQVGSYSLDPSWQDPFKSDNDKSEENIWALVNGRWGGAWSFIGPALHYSHDVLFGVSGWNGYVTQEAAFKAYQDNDLRKNQFLIGLQVSATGDTAYATEEYAGQPLELVPYIARMTDQGQSDMTSGEENSGARAIKYPLLNPNDPLFLASDIVLYRLADIYLMKAEALMRLNGNKATQEAVDLVNAMRERSFEPADWPAEAYTTSTLTMDTLLAERGREFFWESWRRQDMIRFGKFTGSWWDKQPSDATRRIFPIPRRATASNSNLEQNPGYN